VENNLILSCLTLKSKSFPVERRHCLQPSFPFCDTELVKERAVDCCASYHPGTQGGLKLLLGRDTMKTCKWHSPCSGELTI